MTPAPKPLSTTEARRLQDRAWFWRKAREMAPRKLPPILDWAEEYVRLFGVMGQRFNRTLTPWTILPIQLADAIGKIRYLTFIKPVQTGGSAVGEIAICRWIVKGFHRVQWIWDTDEFAEKRWDGQEERILKACKPVYDRWPLGGTQRSKDRKCFVVFPNITLEMLGSFSDAALDSDSVPFQVIEEAHKYEQGKLGKAFRRGTACAFPISLIISNASMEDDDLHRKFKTGTQQHWEVQCPGCGQYHIMRTRWEDSRPDLGGLRYDIDTARSGGPPGTRNPEPGTLNYNKLAPTLRYQMPCGHITRNDPNARRALSDTGRYSAPFNDGALPNDVSLTYQAVTCHNIDWVTLVQEKHDALRALKTGDPKPWKKYLQERECQFYSQDSHPFQGTVVITTGIHKNREGLKNRAARLWKADWQQGFKHLGQLEHFWLVIEDVQINCNSMIVFEGKVNSENELLAILEEHDAIERGAGVVDCSKNTKHLLEFCYRNGFNAIMSNESWKQGFLHREDGVRRFYDEGQAICGKLNVPPRHEPVATNKGWAPHPKEPIVINVNKAGMIANHFFIREHKERVIASALLERETQLGHPLTAAEKAAVTAAVSDEWIERIIPEDVTEDFRIQYESWIRVGKAARKRPDEVISGGERFQQIRRDDHLLICLAGIDMLKDWSGLLGDRLAELGTPATTPGPQSEP